MRLTPQVPWPCLQQAGPELMLVHLAAPTASLHTRIPPLCEFPDTCSDQVQTLRHAQANASARASLYSHTAAFSLATCSIIIWLLSPALRGIPFLPCALHSNVSLLR